jgi:hypothetical protein
MTRMTFDISMSLGGFVTASNVSAEEPLGDGGQRLHEWAFGDDERNRELLVEAVSSVGAVIAGRRTYDLSVPWWGADARRVLLGFRCLSSPTPSLRRYPRRVCTPS